MAAPVIGQQDYRGYLNYLAQKNPNAGIKNAAQTLIGRGGTMGFVNNKGQLVSGQGILSPELQRLNQEFFKNYQGLSAAKPPGNIGSIYGGGGGGAAPVYAPPLNLKSIQARASAAATKAVNPYYAQQMANYLAQVKAKQQQQQAQYQTNVQNLEEALKQTTEGNELTRVRTGEDVTQNLEDIAIQGEQFQTDTGQQFEDTRQALGQELAQTGTSGGAAKQQVLRTTKEAATQEQRQVQQFERQKQTQNLFKSRTLEDLLKSDELAKTVKVRGEKQAKFDLDSYITNLNLESRQQQADIKKAQKRETIEETSRQARLLVNAFIQGIKNPAQQLAAVQRYGGAF